MAETLYKALFALGKIDLDKKPDYPASDEQRFFESNPFRNSRDYMRVEMVTAEQKADFESKMGITPDSVAVLEQPPFDSSEIGGGDTVYQNFFFQGEKMPDTVMKVMIATPPGEESVVSVEALRLGSDQMEIFQKALMQAAASGPGIYGFSL